MDGEEDFMRRQVFLCEISWEKEVELRHSIQNIQVIRIHLFCLTLLLVRRT